MNTSIAVQINGDETIYHIYIISGLSAEKMYSRNSLVPKHTCQIYSLISMKAYVFNDNNMDETYGHGKMEKKWKHVYL